MKVSRTPDRDLLRAARAALRGPDRPGTQLNARWFTEGRAICFQDTPAPAIVVKVDRQAAALEHEVAMMGRGGSGLARRAGAFSSARWY